MAQKDKPPQLTMLEAKGIFARDCFRFQDQPEVYYCITRNKRFVGLNGEEMPLSEDDIWERYDIIEKISRAAFAQAQSEYRDRLWQARGQPNTLELASLAPAFLDAYCNHYEDRKWQAVCRYEEETFRRLLDLSMETLFPHEAGTYRDRQRTYQQMYRDLVLAKAAQAAG